MDKWLKDRRGRTLTFDDLDHYQRIAAALEETIGLMEKVDELTSKIVSSAVRERLERERRERSIETRIRELHAIGQRCASLLRGGPSATEHGDLLYDENGLPK